MGDSSTIWGIPASIGVIWNHRFFADRVKFLRNEPRVLAISSLSVIGFDYHDKPKERIDFSKLQTIQCGRKPNELVLRPRDGDAITYHCDARDTLAAHIMYGYDVAMSNRGASFRVDRVGREENMPVMLWITSSIITRTDASGATTLSQQLLTDIEYIIEPLEQTEFLIKFKNSEAHTHRYSTQSRGQIVELILATLHNNFNITVGVRECVTLEDAIQAHIFAPEKGHYVFETKAKKHYQNHEPRECTFALTRTHVVIFDAKQQKIWSSREIAGITALVIQQDQFEIQYNHLHYTRLSSPDSETILANLLGISKESGHALEVLCREPARGVQVLPLPRSAEDQKMDDYFVQKLLHITEANSEPSKFQESMGIIQEYNANVPIIGPTIKEKKVILCIFGWLQFAWSALWEARPESRNIIVEEVIELLGTLTRIFSSSRFALEEATNAKALKPLLLIVLKSGFFKLNYGVCALVQSMISHYDPKANKQATINRNFVFTNDVLEEIMTLLSKSASKFTNTLATYLFTNLLECCLYTQIHSTDWQLAKILDTLLLKNLHVLFELCRSPCRAVAKNLTILIEFVLQEAKTEPAVFKTIQDECRNQCALIWQVYLAVSTPPAHRALRMGSSSSSLSSSTTSLPAAPPSPHDEPPINLVVAGLKGGLMHTKPLFPRVVGAMADGNPESMDLITRDGSIVATLRKPMHLRVMALMCEGNAKSAKLVSKMFPLHLFPTEAEYISNKFQPKQEKKRKVTCNPGEPSWYVFFERVHQDFEEPTLVWNDATRKELCDTIIASVGSFIDWESTSPSYKRVWNFEEFNVKYQCLDEQLKVGKYYVNTVLTLGNKCHLTQPDIFLDMVIHKLLMLHHPPSHQVAYLRAITWCYVKYHTNIASFLLRIENMLVLLETQPQAVVDHVLLYFEEIFITPKNIREFVKYDGVEKVLKLLQNTTNHCTKVTEDELGIYTRLSTIANILTKTLSTINPVDVFGTLKVPIPQTKSTMSGPYLEILTNVIASLCDRPADATRDYVLDGFTSLLEKIMSYNDLVTSTIYKTGLVYFLLYFDGPSFLSNSKLLQKIHLKQALYANGSILQDYLPPPMINLLNEDAASFSDVFTSCSASPVLVWSQDMRELLRQSIFDEIGPFLEQLKTEGGTAHYTFNQITVHYPIMENIFVVGKYYIDNLVDDYYWNSWQIPNREEFFVHACSYLHNITSLTPRHRFFLLKLIRQQYSKISGPVSFAHYPSFNEWVEKFVVEEVTPNLGQPSADVTNELQRLKHICALRELVEVVCEVVKLLELTSRHTGNMDLFMSNNGKQVLFCCLKCLLISSKYEFSFRGLIMECLVLVMEWVHRNLSNAPQQVLDKSALFDIAKCSISPPLAHTICSIALDCIHILIQRPANLESLCQVGIHYYLLRVIMSYIVAKRSRRLPVEEEGSLSNAAILATRIFTILSEVEYIRDALIELIMEENFVNLTARDRRLPEPLTFIAHLGSPSSGDSKWNSEAFDHVFEKINGWIREIGSADSHEAITLALNPQTPLQVGSVNVDVFNASPTSTPNIPANFNVLLLDALKKLFEEQPTSPDLPLIYGQALCLAHAINNSLSLKHEPSPDALAILLPTLTHPVASGMYIATVLNILLKLLLLDQFKAVLAQEIRANKLNAALLQVPLSRDVFLPALCKFTTEKCPDYPSCIIESNLLVVIFSFLVETGNAAHRLAAAQLLHEITKSPTSQLLILPFLRHLFPPYLVNAFIRFEPDEIITLFDMNTLSAEFIWNEGTRNAVREFVASILSRDTNLLASKLVYSDLERELQICNVYLNPYNKSPAPFTLTSPAQFLHALFAEFSVSGPSAIILQSLQHLLVAYPELAREVTSEEAERLVQILRDSQADMLAPTITILDVLSEENPLFISLPAFDDIGLLERLREWESNLEESEKGRTRSFLTKLDTIAREKAHHTQNGNGTIAPKNAIEQEQPQNSVLVEKVNGQEKLHLEQEKEKGEKEKVTDLQEVDRNEILEKKEYEAKVVQEEIEEKTEMQEQKDQKENKENEENKEDKENEEKENGGTEEQNEIQEKESEEKEKIEGVNERFIA